MSRQPKPPINRKVLWMAVAAVVVVGILGAIAAFVNDPRKNRASAEEQERLQEVMRMPAGSEATAIRQLDEQGRAAARAVANEADAGVDPDRAAFDRYMGAPGEPAPGVSSAQPGSGQPPVFDEDLLRMLTEAQDEVGRRPDLGNVAGGSVSGLQSGGSSGGFRGAGGRDAPTSIIHEKYESEGRSPAATLRGDSRDDDERAAAMGASGIYEAIKPEAPSSDRIINQGVGIPAVLMSRIDTRNAGPITARVNRTIYDSRTHTVALVPQGSRLVGSYGSNVDAGADRIEVVFERLILPDGRSFALPGMPASGGDGSIGVVGKYRSNIIRAIGPTFLVSILGQVADRQIERAIPSRDESSTPWGQQAPASVLKETMPKVNEAVMQRYQGAKPYFIVEPGQDIRVILTDDLELPEPVKQGSAS